MWWVSSPDSTNLSYSPNLFHSSNSFYSSNSWNSPNSYNSPSSTSSTNPTNSSNYSNSSNSPKWLQGVTRESDTRERHQRATPESGTREDSWEHPRAHSEITRRALWDYSEITIDVEAHPRLLDVLHPIFFSIPRDKHLWSCHHKSQTSSGYNSSIAVRIKSAHHRIFSETSQELRMLSSVTLNCQVTKIVRNSSSQLSEM